jgi:hypothetical protein
MWVAFLDIEKAFDSFGHAELLKILAARLPAEWVEVIRRLLIGNTTTVCGVEVQLGRGCFQGSPLSPTLCLCFVDDFAIALRDFLVHNPGKVRPPWKLPQDLNLTPEIAHLLLFADDTTEVTTSPEALQDLLNVAYAWAQRRQVRFSHKSMVACLIRRGTAADAPPPQFRLGPLSLPITKGSLSYLGVPVRTYKKGQHWAKAYDLDIPELSRLAGALTSAFRLPDGHMYVSCKAFLQGVHSALLAKALYPTPVVDVDYEALDTLV